MFVFADKKRSTDFSEYVIFSKYEVAVLSGIPTLYWPGRRTYYKEFGNGEYCKKSKNQENLEPKCKGTLSL